jgi:hypothetical protein
LQRIKRDQWHRIYFGEWGAFCLVNCRFWKC